MATKIQNKSFKQIAQLVGETPFYVYDRETIQHTVHKLKNLFPSPIQLYYAIKANPMPAIIDYFSSQLDGFDVSSLEELHSAINSGTSPKKISFAGPGKSETELTAAITSGCIVNVESTNELQHIKLIENKINKKASIALRINPDFTLKRSGVNMTGYASAFGIDEELIPQCLDFIKDNKMKLCGFHIYSGSQNLNAKAIIESHHKIFELIAELINNHQLSINHLNIGGGFGIPYFKGDLALDIEPIADNLKHLIQQYQDKLADADIILELGRYLIGESGYYVSKITDIKQSKGKKFAIVDGGLHHHLANSGNFGQVIRKNYPVFIEKTVTNNDLLDKKPKELVDVVGPLCTPLDILAKDIQLPVVEIGDLFIVSQSGAYGKTASPENFLGHGPVKEIFI